MIKQSMFYILKLFLLWLVTLIASVIAATFINVNAGDVVADGPLSGGQAFLLVNILHVFVISLIAVNANSRGWRLALLVAVTLYAAQSFLLIIEAIYFMESVKVPLSMLVNGSLHALTVSIVAGIACMLLWRNKAVAVPESYFDNIEKGQLVQRMAIVAVTYVLSYFVAGYYIAWAAPEVQAYYGFGSDITLPPLIAFQLLRGAMWGLLAYWIACSLCTTLERRAIIVGANFSVLATAQLLYPNAYMPWPVRLPHIIEVGISNFVFGALAVVILFGFKRAKHKPES